MVWNLWTKSGQLGKNFQIHIMDRVLEKYKV